MIDPGASGLAVGDHVVGIVRRPDPVPCPNCAVGEWDMCTNGGYTERGIKQVDGFMSERWRIEPEYAVKVDSEPRRARGPPRADDGGGQGVGAHRGDRPEEHFGSPSTVLVLGAGPIGLLAALIGVQHGGEVHVLDRVTGGRKPALVEALGATYHSRPVSELGPDPGHRRRVHGGACL